MWSLRWPRRPLISSTNFAYKRYRGGRAPIIPIKVLAGHRWRTISAYVDSGAAYSVLTAADAKRLGLLKVKGRRLAVTTSSGESKKITLHRLWVKIGKDRLSVTFGVPRGFDIDFNLLGRRDLFRRYRICFDDKNAFLTFTKQTD